MSDWAVTAVIGLLIAALTVGFGTAGYFVATRRARRPFVAFILRYAVAFLSLLLLEAAFLWLAPPVHTALRHATAVAAGWLVGMAGAANSVAGSILTLHDSAAAFEIDVGCLGGILFWSYIALVLAEPAATWRQRLAGLAAGCAALLAFNLFRISVSVYVEWSAGRGVHNYFYLLNMAFVLCVWALWLRLVRPARQPPEPERT